MKKNFDLTNWILFSERRNSQNYVSKDKKLLAKIFTDFSQKLLNEVQNEKEIISNAIEIGINTPNIYDIVELDDGRYGLIYEYIEDKKSLSRIISENPENTEIHIKKFAEMGKNFHSIKTNKNKFESMEERIIKNIKEQNVLNDSQKLIALNYLESMEKLDYCIHGDFQPSNFIISNGKEYVIDLGGISYGNPLLDVGFFYFFTNFLPYTITKSVFKCDEKYVKSFWNYFLKYYFEDKTKEYIDYINKEIKKIAMVSFMSIFSIVIPGDELNQIYKNSFNKVFYE